MSETTVTTAFLDANVLYPALLRNIFLRLASANMFQARWSARVHDEWVSALIRNRPDIPAARIERIRHLMETHFQAALVEGYEHRIDSVVLPDADDRHVLAAALHCGASVIVTTNLRDFPDVALGSFGIQAINPDTFILRLIDHDKGQVAAALRRLRLSLTHPPHTAADLLAGMKRSGLAASADAVASVSDTL